MYFHESPFVCSTTYSLTKTTKERTEHKYSDKCTATHIGPTSSRLKNVEDFEKYFKKLLFAGRTLNKTTVLFERLNHSRPVQKSQTKQKI